MKAPETEQRFFLRFVCYMMKMCIHKLCCKPKRKWVALKQHFPLLHWPMCCNFLIVEMCAGGRVTVLLYIFHFKFNWTISLFCEHVWYKNDWIIFKYNNLDVFSLIHFNYDIHSTMNLTKSVEIGELKRKRKKFR